jgi:hypothetical protein
VRISRKKNALLKRPIGGSGSRVEGLANDVDIEFIEDDPELQADIQAGAPFASRTVQLGPEQERSRR